METIILASASALVRDKMELQVPLTIRSTATFYKVDPGTDFLDYLRYEIPELVILHWDGDLKLLIPLFEGLERDPWLDSVGIILVVPDVEEALDTFQGFSIAYFMAVHELDRNLGRVISILDEKRDFLNYDGIIKKITALSGELALETDLLLVQYYSSLFSNYLFKEGRVDRSKKYSVRLALEELLTNAMEHGNAGITFDEKTQFQEKGISVQALVEERMAKAPWRGRRVTVTYSITPATSRFTITDQGEGFDTSKIPTKGDVASLRLAHGRGIFMARSGADILEYNRTGNRVSVEFIHNGKSERSIPPGFVQAAPKQMAPSDVVFWENSSGDHIYYIVSGEYEVFVGGKKVAKLTPSDVFMGEMSFLLGNRRTATVITSKPGKLVEVSRQIFTDAVKKYPNYGIFLSKMLAKRLRNANRLYAS